MVRAPLLRTICFANFDLHLKYGCQMGYSRKKPNRRRGLGYGISRDIAETTTAHGIFMG